MLSDDYDVTVDHDGPGWYVNIRPRQWLVSSTVVAVLKALGVYDRDRIERLLMRDPEVSGAIADALTVILPGSVEVENTEGVRAQLFTHHGMPGGAWEPVAEPPYCYSDECPNHVVNGDTYCDDCTSAFVAEQRREDAAEMRRLIG